MSDDVIDTTDGRDAIHDWFSLTYANYLVLPRSVLQSLPPHVQVQLVKALDSVEAQVFPASLPPKGRYRVQLVDARNRFMHDPLADYQRGRRVVTRKELCEMCDREEPS